MFCVMCLDKPDSEELRLANRQAHLEYVTAQDYVQIGGPLMSDDGTKMIGSLLLLDTQDTAKAKTFVDNDPYQKAGLFARVEVRRFNHLLGALAAPQG